MNPILELLKRGGMRLKNAAPYIRSAIPVIGPTISDWVDAAVGSPVGSSMQRFYHENFDPEGINATRFTTERARAAAAAPWLYQLGVPFVPRAPAGFNLPQNEDTAAFAGGGPALGDIRQSVEQLGAENVAARRRYSHAQESWRTLENLANQQNTAYFQEMDAYRKNYKRRHGTNPTLEEVKIKSKAIRSRQVNPSDFIRGQTLNSASPMQRAGRDVQPIGSRNQGDLLYGIPGVSKLPWLIEQGIPGEVEPGQLFLPKMDRIRPYVIPK